MTEVLYTGAFRFPEKDAAAFRVRSVACLFEKAGCRVSFAGWEQAEEGGSHYVFHGYDCYPQSEFRQGSRNLVHRFIGFYARGFKTLRWLASRSRFDAIVVYNPPALFALLLLLRCHRDGTRLILDSTEWYEGEHLPGGRFGPAALENWLRMICVYPGFRNVICISRFLERHYARRNVINVPPLSTKKREVSRRCSSSIRIPIETGVKFLYAGDAAKKDRLCGFISALPAIAQTLQRPIELCIAGMEQRALDDLLHSEGMNSSAYAPYIRCYGRVSHCRVFELYEECHFSVLFRENKRYAWAGFPTKAVESWSHGCPIIGNSIGDFGLLAEDRLDAILVQESEIASRVPALLMSVITENRYAEMSAHCRAKADQLFSPDVYFKPFRRFLEQTGLSLKA